MRPIVVAGLDIGSSNTCAVIASLGSDARRPEVKILGVGVARTGGVRREIVANIEETTESVRKALKEAELMAGVQPERVYAGIAGEHIQAATSNGVVAVGSQEITAADVRRVHEVARAVALPADRELLHVLSQEYIVDHQRGIREPTGMAGTRLEVEVYIVTAGASAGRNLRKAVSRAGYRVDALVHESLATALAALSDEEKEVGCALVTLGGGATEVAVFRDGKLRHLATVPWGGHAVTHDLVKGLSISVSEAERIKEQYGVALAQYVDPREVVELPATGSDVSRRVALELVAHIIEQRLDEILGLAAREIEAAGESEGLAGGVVLTGGATALAGTLEVAQQIFPGPVRIGMPHEGLTGLTDAVAHPRYATAVGLAVYGAHRAIEAGGGGMNVAALGEGAVARIAAWLREFF